MGNEDSQAAYFTLKIWISGFAQMGHYEIPKIYIRENEEKVVRMKKIWISVKLNIV